MPKRDRPQGCGCANIPISVILLFLGGGFWWFKKNGLPDIEIGQINSLLSRIPGIEIQIPVSEPAPPPTPPTPTPTLPPGSITKPPLPATPEIDKAEREELEEIKSQILTDWEQKKIRGIYLSRYQITNNASEQTIRDRVRYYKSQGFNTIIHGVWGNACTMYDSEVMQQTLGYPSCPNQFRDPKATRSVIAG